MGLPYLFPDLAGRGTARGRTGNIYKRPKKGAFSGRARPALLSFLVPPPSGHSFISSSSSLSSSVEGARVVILPTLAPQRKVRTASVARSPWKRSLATGARGCFRLPDAPPNLLYLGSPGLACRKQVVACRSLLSHSTCWTGSCRSSRRGTIQSMSREELEEPAGYPLSLLS